MELWIGYYPIYLLPYTHIRSLSGMICQMVYRKRKDEIEKAYNEYVEQINAKDLPPECKEILISPGRDIVSLVMEANTKR
jgi:hypothetical protein